MSKRELELVCIMCPASCTMKVTVEPDGKITVVGNQCPRGAEYAKQEVLNPVRMVMSVVKVKNGDMPTVSVITSRPVPKKCIPEIMKATAMVEVEAPVELGQVIVRDVCGVDLIATRRVRRVT